VQVLPLGAHQPLPSDPRHPRPRPHARRQQPLLCWRSPPLPLHGLLHVRQLHRLARDRRRQDPRRRPLRQGLLHRLRRHHRRRRRDQHRQGPPWRQRRRLRPRRHRPQRHSSRPFGRRQQDRRRRSQPAAPRDRREIRHDPLRQPEGGRGRSRPLPRQPHRRRRRLLLRVRRRRQRHAAGARVLSQGLGHLRHHRRRRRWPGDRHPPLPAGHRPRLEGLSLRRRQGPPRRAQDRRLVHGRQDQHRRPDHPRPAASIRSTRPSTSCTTASRSAASIRSVITFSAA
jgi:hypothetical protein